MTIKFGLTADGNDAFITGDGELRVATSPFVTSVPYAVSFSNPTFGAMLNQNVSFSGTPVGIHDGIDSVLWTGSVIVGSAARFTFNSATQAFAGAQSIDCTNARDNETALLTAGAPIIHGNYTAITGAVFITGWPTTGTKQVMLQLRLAGVAMGVELDIGAFVDTTLFNVWQTFAIPLSAFNIVAVTTADELTIRVVDIGGGAPPDVYLDALQFEEFGLPLEYIMRPDLSTVFHIKEIRLTIAANVTGGFSYDQFFGVTKLSNGIVFQVQQNGLVTYSFTWRQLFDMMVNDVHLIDLFDDGVNTAVSMELEFPDELILDGDITRNNMSMIVNDDLSGLLDFRVTAEGYREI